MPSSVIGPAIGAVIGGIGAGDAADAQSAANQANIKLQKEMYDQTRKDLGPYRDIGGAGAYTLAQLLGLYNPNARSTSNTIHGGSVPAASTSTNASGQQVLTGENGEITVLAEREDGRKRIKTPYGTFWLDKDGVPRGNGVNKAEAWFMSQGGLNGFSNANASANAGALPSEAPPDNFGSLLKNFDNSVFEKDPGYEFRLAEGEKGMNRSLAARGGLLSGAAVKEAGRYNQGYASNEYQNAYNRYTNDQTNIYNRLMGVANMGQNAAAQQASSNQMNANQVGQYNSNIGDAKANASVNQGIFANQGLSSMMGSSFGGANTGAFGFTDTNSPFGRINWTTPKYMGA